MTVKIKHNKAHVLYKALGYDHCILDNSLPRRNNLSLFSCPRHLSSNLMGWHQISSRCVSYFFLRIVILYTESLQCIKPALNFIPKNVHFSWVFLSYCSEMKHWRIQWATASLKKTHHCIFTFKLMKDQNWNRIEVSKAQTTFQSVMQ